MIIFNTTFHLDDEVHDPCVLHLRDKYIKRAMESGHLTEPRLALIHHQHEEGGTSYSLQFRTKDMTTLNEWMNTQSKAIHADLLKEFGDKVAGFVTILEEIDL